MNATLIEQPLTVAATDDAAEWDAFVYGHEAGTVDHLFGWRQIFQRVFRHRSEYLVARRGRVVVGVLPLVVFNSRLFGRQLVSLPMLNYGGLLVADPDAANALVGKASEIAGSVSARHVELRHRARMTNLPERQHKVSMRLELPATASQAWEQLDRKVRNQVRKAQKSGLTATVGRSELVSSFYAVFAENMRDLGTPVYPERLFREVLEAFPDVAGICLVRDGNGHPIAAAVTLHWRGAVLVPWASSLKSHRQLSPNMLLYWTMVEEAASRGAQVFDFGRSSPGGGTFQFKEQWGAVSEPQHWEYVLLRAQAVPEQGPSDGRFNLAIEAWKRLPLWLANTAGPHIVRNIP